MAEPTLPHLLRQYDPRHFSPAIEPIDPVELAVSNGHAVTVDLLEAVLRAQTVTRCMQIHEAIGLLVRTLQAVESAALNHADDLCGGR